MKKNTSKLLIIVMTIFSISVFSNSCYDDNGDAIVTIHLERNDLAAMGIKPEKDLGIIDRILTFFSTRAEAAPTWNANKSNLTLTISSPSSENKQFLLPSTATSFKTTLTPSTNTTFTITTETDWGPSADNIQKNWGGHLTIDLKPGDQDITIKILPMTYINSIFNSAGSINISCSLSGANPLIQTYKAYRSTSIDGVYTYYATSATASFSDYSLVTIYFYRISTVCDLGDTVLREGVLSDPKTWL